VPFLAANQAIPLGRVLAQAYFCTDHLASSCHGMFFALSISSTPEDFDENDEGFIPLYYILCIPVFLTPSFVCPQPHMLEAIANEILASYCFASPCMLALPGM
jgi:hypothetical protein